MQKIKSTRANRVTVNDRTLAKGEEIEVSDDRARLLVERGVAEYSGKAPDEGQKRQVLKNLSTPPPDDVPDPDAESEGAPEAPKARRATADTAESRAPKAAERAIRADVPPNPPGTTPRATP